MTPRTVVGFSRLLVLVPVTVCATIYVNDPPSSWFRCSDRTPPPQTLAKCRYDDDCMRNAYCWNQQACLCKEDYIVFRNRTHVECLKVASAIGDPCEVDVQCQVTFAPYSECRQNICQCSDGSHYEEGRCYESVGLGKVCQSHHNCYIKNSYCVTGFCVCTLNYHPNPRNDGCIPSAELGDKCSNDYECVTENSRCIEKCLCKVDHVMSSDGKRCLKAADSVGEPCQEDSQCVLFLDNTKCGADGKCRCVENWHQRGSICLNDIGLNQRCLTHTECVTETYRDSSSNEVMNVDCVNGYCACAKDYTMTANLRDCIRYSENAASMAWQGIRILVVVTSVATLASIVI
nr:PREDICTED: prion-like-(Q/N-rich) domain-bearing protein 25 isoform X1 [Megachile rotundata]XP_012141328.1 PREDICTED: prion-like-(Q/N-rich) domain-bearing protein 25 isoform X1 [Megachile rotundata]XP_012141329.1 PREDICTED: prion-like-(Q/N-rich) domain-bearing protein 25 isoform X1 [Megachile rotundata]XP_012141330.1 PREDICTED: prion-like-(Q/N-rich) domain-bearing protein 25 isoform X1 [Megachile rotundata]XP_012141331.1 PREDICTED: prion-like-(Q/N-rich) domain-bearing protein 25 isoform X1 [M